MSITKSYNFKIRANNTGIDDSWDGLTFSFHEPDDSPEDISGSTFSFIASDRNGVTLRIAGIVTDNTVTIPFSLADSNTLIANSIATYVLRQVRGADFKDRVAGSISIVGGPSNV